MKKLMIAAALLALATPAFAEGGNGGGAAGAPHGLQGKMLVDSKLTVRQVIGLMNGLKLLDSAPTGQLNRDGTPVMGPTGFKFNGDTLLTIAIDLNHATETFTNYQIATNALIRQLSNGGSRVPDDKNGKYLEEDAKMGDAPSGVILSRISVEDLCLEVKQPKCPDKNNIPGSTLSLLVPILDGLK